MFAVTSFFKFLWYGIMALSDWLKGFALVDAWVFTFFLPKLFIVLLGLAVTPLPVWLLICLSFLPLGLTSALIFVAFVVAFLHF